MSQYGWNDCPANVRLQVTRLVESFRLRLNGNLIGIYLHGSLATGCFNPLRSDIDLLVITHHKIRVEVKHSLIKILLDTSLKPSPIEISFLRHSKLIPWKHPTPFDLHYSEDWREGFVRELVDGTWKEWNKIERVDEDLAAHITVTNERGVCLYGQAISEVFPRVPKQDFIDSVLLGDVLSTTLGLEAILQYPVYVVLNACRTLAYLKTGRIMSKEEGGVWGLQNMSLQYHETIDKALEVYRNSKDGGAFRRAQLIDFATYMQNELRRVTQ